jgi:AcrR family transcriptional regulator
MAKQSRSAPVMKAVLDAVAERLLDGDESLIRIPEICEATGVNYGSVYHHFGSREGVIDAAYNMIFSNLVTDDIAKLREIGETSNTLAEYQAAMLPLVELMATGDDRVRQRAMRVRIVAAAETRKELRELIGETQARLTDELVRIFEHGQNRGWLRRDVSARSIAVLVQAVIFGRTLDDVSSEPINQNDWEHAMFTLFLNLLDLA